MPLEERWEQDKNPISPVNLENLVCSNCSLKIEDNTITCRLYAVKPTSVLKGGVCSGYKK